MTLETCEKVPVSLFLSSANLIVSLQKFVLLLRKLWYVTGTIWMCSLRNTGLLMAPGLGGGFFQGRVGGRPRRRSIRFITASGGGRYIREELRYSFITWESKKRKKNIFEFHEESRCRGIFNHECT